jgi:hypothetical protein
MRATYRVLALLIPIGVVLQAAAVAYAWFAVLHDADKGAVFDEGSAPNAGHVVHSIGGMMVLPVIGLLLLIVSLFAKIPGGIKWAGIVFGVLVLQVLLAVLSFGAPIVGALHGINAFALAGVAAVAARKARTTEPAASASLDAPVAAS